jgi:hypothetical protein
VYAPTAQHGAHKFTEFLAEVSLALSTLNREGGTLCLVGDFNTDLTSPTSRADRLRKVLQKGGVAAPAEALLNLRPTFIRGGQSSSIDWICVSRGEATGYHVWGDRDLCNDGHAAVTADLHLESCTAKRRPTAQWGWRPTAARATDWTEYQRRAAAKLAGYKDWIANVAQACQTEEGRESALCIANTVLTNALLSAADEGLGLVHRSGSPKSWWSDELEALSTVRKQRWSCYALSRSPEDFSSYRQAKRAFTHAARRRKRAQWAEAWSTTAKDRAEGLTRLWWRASKRLRGEAEPLTGEVYIDENKEQLSQGLENRLEAWRSFYASLSEEPKGEWNCGPTHLGAPTDCEWDNPPTYREVKKSIKDTHRWKAGGDDEVLPYLLTQGGPPVVGALTSLLELVWTWEQVPQAWKDAVVCPIYKDGDPCDRANYRPISLLNVVGKTAERVIQRRLSKKIEETRALSDQQLGFRPGLGCLEAILWVTEVLKARKAAGKQTILIFLDVRKAYDTVWHDGLWCRLAGMGLSGKEARITQDWHKGGRARVRIAGTLSEYFPLRAGVRQGGISSPTLYTAFIDEINHDLQAAGIGIMEESIWCGNSMYADDMVVMVETVEEARKAMRIVEGHARKWRYKLNPSKCKAMVVGRNSAHPVHITLDGEAIEVTKAFRYLGVWISENLKWNRHVEELEKRATKRMAALRMLAASSGGMNAEIALELWRAELRPMWEHGIGIWGLDLPKGLMERLERAQRKLLRGVLAVGKTTASSAILFETNCERIADRATKLGLGLWGKYQFGHGGGHQLRSILFHRLAPCASPPQWSWCHKILQAAAELGLGEDAVDEMSQPLWAGRVRRAIENRRWADLDQEAAEKPKLRTYNTIGPDPGEMGPYLRYSYLLGGRVLTRLRLGTNGLAIETGRWEGKLAKERTCRHCNNAVEDEMHFIGHCPAYTLQRQKWWHRFDKFLPGCSTQDWITSETLYRSTRTWARAVLDGGRCFEDPELRRHFRTTSAHMAEAMWRQRQEREEEWRRKGPPHLL